LNNSFDLWAFHPHHTQRRPENEKVYGPEKYDRRKLFWISD